MSFPQPIDAFIRDYLTVLVFSLGVAALFLLLLVLMLYSRLGRLTRLYRRLTHGASGGNIEEQLLGYVDQVRSVESRMQALEVRTERLSATARRSLQHVSVVRYDAFEDVGGEQSFSVAIVDADRNGAVISSVYSRSDVRVYAKAIQNGRASHPLSVEEQRALTAAQSGETREVLEGV